MSAQLFSQRGIQLEPLSREQLETDAFVVFDTWLDHFSEKLQDLAALLMFDEFEQLSEALRGGRFDAQPLLGMLRNLIQHRSKFRILIAGSHTLSEVSAWSSYLINVRTLKLGFLKKSESRQLVVEPMPSFALKYEPDALELVLALTNGHPYLLQLLCARIVELKNQQKEEQRFLATYEDVESAVMPALDDAAMVFEEMIANQISHSGHAVLRILAQRGPQALLHKNERIPAALHCDEQVWNQLVLRDIVEMTEHGYRFQVELFRRWFAANHNFSEI